MTFIWETSWTVVTIIHWSSNSNNLDWIWKQKLKNRQLYNIHLSFDFSFTIVSLNNKKEIKLFDYITILPIMWHTLLLYWFCSGYFKVKSVAEILSFDMTKVNWDLKFHVELLLLLLTILPIILTYSVRIHPS